MTPATLARPPRRPHCPKRSMDEYTHFGCPEGESRAHHRHWVCTQCVFEWIDFDEKQRPELEQPLN
jgi:hypothetical protein